MINFDGIKVFTIRSGKGDCVHLRFHGTNGYPHNIIIDSGPTSTSGSFRALVNSISSLGEPLDALIITHYDDDHIGGVMKVGDTGFKAVYFNAYDRSLIDNTGNLSASQNQRLFHALSKESTHSSVIAGNQINIAGAHIRVIGPTPDNLDRAKLEMIRADAAIVPLSSVSDWKYSLSELAEKKYPSADNSYSNHASIIFVLEYGNIKMLFCGDAPAGAVVEGLHSLYGDTKQHFDLVKLPHHGSSRNISNAFLDSFTGNSFLICADGTSHPNKQTIAKILKSRLSATFFSNYSWWTNGFLLSEDMKYIDDGKLVFEQV